MKIFLSAVALVLAVLVVGYLLTEKRPGYGAYYGIARLTGSTLDIGFVNFTTLRRHETPNDALLCPPGRCPDATPDWEAKTYDMPPAELLSRLTEIAFAEPNTAMLDCHPPCERLRLVQYSPIMHFPDTIDVDVLSAGTGKSTLAIYSRSLLGRSDFGVNRARIARWLTGLDKP